MVIKKDTIYVIFKLLQAHVIYLFNKLPIMIDLRSYIKVIN